MSLSEVGFLVVIGFFFGFVLGKPLKVLYNVKYSERKNKASFYHCSPYFLVFYRFVRSKYSLALKVN